MISQEFPGCCAARVVTGLGGSSHARYGRLEQSSMEELRERFNYHILDAETFHQNILVMTTTTEQRTANKFLRKIGCSYSPWQEKMKHPETRLRVWVYNTQQGLIKKEDLI